MRNSGYGVIEMIRRFGFGNMARVAGIPFCICLETGMLTQSILQLFDQTIRWLANVKAPRRR